MNLATVVGAVVGIGLLSGLIFYICTKVFKLKKTMVLLIISVVLSFLVYTLFTPELIVERLIAALITFGVLYLLIFKSTKQILR